MEYKKGYVAFLDILGFQNIVHDGLPKILSCYSTINDSIGKFRNTNYFFGEIQHFIVSDSIILSIEASKEEFGHQYKPIRKIIAFIQKIMVSCLKQDIWIRGHLTYGDYYHDKVNQNIVGPAYIQAYECEAKDQYPRVCIGKPVLESFDLDSKMFKQEMEYDSKEYINLNHSKKEFFLLGRDDEIFIDYVSKAFFDEEGALKEKIYKHSENMPSSAMVKYAWLQEYIKSKYT